MTDIMKVGDTINAKETITSIELVKQINLFRKEEGNRAELLHKSLLEIIRDEFSDEINEQKILPVTYKDAKGENRPMFELTLSQAKQILVRESKFVRKAMIAYIDKLEGELKKYLPKTFAEALRLAAEQAEQIEKQQERIEEMKPKEEFFDQVTDSKDACDMATVAKVLNMGIGRNKLFEILRDNNILQERNAPYQRYIDLGWFRIIETQFTKPTGDICINFKTIVYQKGIEGIRKLLISLGYNKAGN